MEYTKRHICNTCQKEFPTCDSKKIVFGNGVGNDNVVNCDAYMKTKTEIRCSDYNIDKKCTGDVMCSNDDLCCLECEEYDDCTIEHKCEDNSEEGGSGIYKLS